MATTMHLEDQAASATAQEIADQERRAQARAKRIAAIRRVAGIWAARDDIPADGLEYQRTLRSEWE